MLQSSTQLAKNHGDDLLPKGLKAMEKNAEYGGQQEILALVHVIERPMTVHYEDSDKSNVFGEFLLIALAQTFFIIQKNVTKKEN